MTLADDDTNSLLADDAMTTKLASHANTVMLIVSSGETLCRDNRRLIGTPIIVIARRSQKNRD